MLADYLCPEDGKHLPFDESLGRIARGFRQVIVDRDRGESKVQMRINHLNARKVDTQIVDRVRSLKGNVVWVVISETDGIVEFLLAANHDILIEYDSWPHREQLQSVVRSLADMLGYDAGQWTAFLEITIEYFCFPGIAEELTLNKRVVETIHDTGIGWIEEFRNDGETVSLTVKLADSEDGREEIAAVLGNLFPNAPIRMNLPYDEIPWFE